MKIEPSEVVLLGQLKILGSETIKDEVCLRIIELIQNHLLEKAKDVSGWDTLYKDPSDGRYWELIYPQSNLHGGGPPELHQITFERAKEKYNLKSV